MTIQTLLARARDIWGRRPIAPHIAQTVVVPMGVVYGDICRWDRDYATRGTGVHQELAKELGNMIFSTIRWCDDLGFDPEECVRLAIKCQEQYVVKERLG